MRRFQSINRPCRAHTRSTLARRRGRPRIVTPLAPVHVLLVRPQFRLLITHQLRQVTRHRCTPVSTALTRLPTRSRQPSFRTLPSSTKVAFRACYNLRRPATHSRMVSLSSTRAIKDRCSSKLVIGPAGHAPSSCVSRPLFLMDSAS